MTYPVIKTAREPEKLAYSVPEAANALGVGKSKCGGKGRYKGAGYQGWPVVEAELLSVPPYERALR